MAKEDNGFITWNPNDQSSKQTAITKFADSLDAYSSVNKSTGSAYRDFKDIEPNISVRPGFSPYDYYSFRSDEQIPTQQKSIIKMCMEAYDKVGIIRNVIDLMGDFGCQGINIVHENKSVEDFYQQWFKKVDGKERSERFLNTLYRTGNVLVYRSDALITPEIVKYIKSIAADITVEVPQIEKNIIPWRYNFFNPMSVDLKDGKINLFMGRKRFQITPTSFIDNFKNGSIPANVLETLPVDIKNQIISGQRSIELDPERLSIFYYKKDDWNFWANPMIYAILDDIMMLQKMRLADLSALDGAISNIRLWTMGSLEHQILPTKAGINKLRNILASNVGGGTMELVWGPELKYTESNSQVYKFLGSEKYQSVLNSIYAGLGVPPTLTGMAGNGGGFTNNFISLKTLVERLQYGRDQLVKFWEKETEIIRKAMGFRKAPHIVFDQMSLSDEASEKALLIQLADRDIISNETVLERFKEVAPVEKMRLQRETKARDEEKLPPKASPFHNANHQNDLEKIQKQGDINKKLQQLKPAPAPPGSPKPSQNNGRPQNKSDDGPRKKRVDTPRSKPGVAELLLWAQNSYDFISDTINNAALGFKNKTNLRQLTKSEVSDLELIKLQILTNIEPMSNFTNANILDIVNNNPQVPTEFKSILNSNKISTNSLPLDSYKRQVIATYVEYINS